MRTKTKRLLWVGIFLAIAGRDARRASGSR